MTTQVMRKCIATSEVLPISKMVRFIVDPQGVVIPDIKGDLPGRGLWVSASSDLLLQVVQKKLFAKSAKAKVEPIENIEMLVKKLLVKRVFSVLSIARRSGKAVSGFEKVREMLKKGRCKMVLSSAEDESSSSQKIAGMCRMLNVNFVQGISNDDFSENLATIFGRATVTYASVEKCGITDILNYEVTRLRLFLGGEKV